KVLVQISSPSLTAMRQEHPEEIRKYVAPLLATLNGFDVLRPGAADVYRVFNEIPASPEMIQKVEELLILIGSPIPDQRTAGSKALAELGRPAVLAVLRMELAFLTPEERARLDD